MKRSILKWILYILLLIIMFSFQTSAGNRIVIFGASADLLPFFVAGIAVMEGYKGAAWAAFLAGVLCDVSLAHENVFYCAFYFISACICSIVSDYYLKKAYLTTALWGCVIFIFKAVIRSVILTISVPGLGFTTMLSEELVSMLFSLALSWIIYIPIKYIARIAPVESLKFEGVNLKRGYSEAEIVPKKRKYRIMKDAEMSRQEEHFWSNIFK